MYCMGTQGEKLVLLSQSPPGTGGVDQPIVTTVFKSTDPPGPNPGRFSERLLTNVRRLTNRFQDQLSFCIVEI